MLKGLRAENFTLLDNGVPQKLVSFHAVEGLSGPEDPLNPLAQVVLVLDAINLDDLQIAAAEHAIQKFLRQGDRRLAHPVSIYRLGPKGLSVSVRSSLDGDALAANIGSESSFRHVMDGIDPGNNASVRNIISLVAFGKIVLDQRRKPGRKVLIWIGPGWPADCPGCNKSFDWITGYSTRMREARIALYGVSVWAARADSSNYMEGVKVRRDANSANMVLAVLASNSGGRVLDASSGLAELIRQCADEADAYYTLTFDPPRTSTVDDYHDLKLVVKGQSATMRTWTGYYDEPSFYDQPDTFNEPKTIQQLEQFLADAHRQDGRVLEALSVVGTSGFLPAPERSAGAAPDTAEQREIMSRTLAYLGQTIPRLPDFFATHTTTRYQPRSEKGKKDKQSWKSAGVDGTVRLSSSSVEVIHYRDGTEIADPISTKREAQHKTQSDSEDSLDTHGTFGPMLYTVIKDAAAGSLSWSRWEERSGGRMAIFRFVVPKNQSHYTVSFCCLTDMNNSGVLNWATGYHGELAINPENGGIMYLTVQADLEPRMPLLRAEIMVTYHEVDIGGRSYTCPSHSVALSRKRTVTEIHEWGDTLTTLSPFVTILNDATFTNYHKFGSESRMLPGFATVPNEP